MTNNFLQEHLKSRGMDTSQYACVINEEDCEATFFLFNMSKMLIGYQIYRAWSTDKKCNDPKLGRYFTYSKSGQDAIFGLEVPWKPGPVFVFEGIFKASKAHRLGYNAVAVLTSDPKRMRPLFKIWRATRDIIAVGDADSAGQRLVNRVGRGECSPIDFDEMLDYQAILFLEGLRY